MPHLQSGFHPKLISIWREGYGLAGLKADALAAVTVAIVALPLSMAIAIASHVGPERGLYTAIIGGFLISALGGSRFQIGGPAGAFIVLVAGIVDAHGLDGLLVATIMAGVIIFLAGALQLGKLVRYVPNLVTLGFTAGIAVIILASQIKELFGLALPGAEPAAIFPKIAALWQAKGTFNPYAFSAAALTILVILGVGKYRRSFMSRPTDMLMDANGVYSLWQELQ